MAREKCFCFSTPHKTHLSRPCLQIWMPPHSLHLLLTRPREHMLPPTHCLQIVLCWSCHTATSAAARPHASLRASVASTRETASAVPCAFPYQPGTICALFMYFFSFVLRGGCAASLCKPAPRCRKAAACSSSRKQAVMQDGSHSLSLSLSLNLTITRSSSHTGFQNSARKCSCSLRSGPRFPVQRARRRRIR